MDKETLNIVIPMAGRGQRFVEAGYTDPKPLIEIAGRPMIYWVVENIKPACPHRFIFICQRIHLLDYPHLESTLQNVAPGCEIITLDSVTSGAAQTVLAAKPYINADQPLMIANSDQYVDCDINDYLRTQTSANANGLIMTFWANDPKWSFCKMNDDDTVATVVEKEVVSNDATVGIYNFKSGKDFVRAAEEMIERELKVKGEYYIAPVYNLMIEEGTKIVTHTIAKEGEGMFGLGTPSDLEKFKQSPIYQNWIENEALV